VCTVKIETLNKKQGSTIVVLPIEDKEDNMKSWELSFGLFTGFLFGYRSYPDAENNKIDHVFYVFIFDICLTFQY
jgi:hypothetical protein